jgi:hypothetical protein
MSTERDEPGLPEGSARPGRYEVRVAGQLGKALLAALPHAKASTACRRTVLIVSADRDDLVAILERIVGSGLEVESVRDVSEPRPAHRHDEIEPA